MLDRNRGYTFVELTIVVSILSLLALSVLDLHVGDKVAAEEQVVRQAAENLLEATRGYWSAHRSAPATVNDLLVEGFLRGDSLPPNPLGTGYTVGISVVAGSSALVVVSADITRPGSLSDWRGRLNATDVIPGGVAWRRYVVESSSHDSIRGEAFKGMY